MLRSSRISLVISVAAITAVIFIFMAAVPGKAGAVTVGEVASELECPCDCPLILEDCNMSCGLDWKAQIGEEIKAGKTKEEVIEGFVRKYGEACRITPAKRVRGKIYQYTRGFDTRDWAILYGGVGVWLLAVFFGVFLLVKRFSGKKGGRERKG